MTGDLTTPAYIYAGLVLDVHDGDTYKINVDLGFRVSTQQQIRLHGVNCPELNTGAGKKVKDYVTDLIADKTVLLRSYRGQQSFARWVADVSYQDASLGYVDLARHLVATGHARNATYN